MHEVRKSETVKAIAKDLQDRNDVSEAASRLAFVLELNETVTNDNHTGVLENHDTSVYTTNTEAHAPPAVAWGSDAIPPGGRHNNDFQNYRNVDVVPTVEEMTCTTPSWLPLANNSNAHIENPSQRVLDNNFRLLREDAIASMRESLQDNKKVWKNARVVDLHLYSKGKPLTKASFSVQCDPRSGNIDWKRSKAFSFNTVVALCRGDNIERLGTVTIREESTKDQWLLAKGGPVIGVTFTDDEGFDFALQEMLRNTKINSELIEQRDRRDQAEGVERQQLQGSIDQLYGDMMTYDLVEISQSFFTYKPILETLQGMDSVPLESELVHATPTGVRPQYLPREVTMPHDKYFHGFKCNLDNWSTEDVVDNTSLDHSQAEAVRHGLTSQVSLIQGPPGTGKVRTAALRLGMNPSRNA